MSFQHVAFLASWSNRYTTLKKIVIDVYTLVLPHVLKLSLEVSKAMLPEKYFFRYLFSLCHLSFMKIIRWLQS